ncbi:electron transport protein SCO1/SenC [Hirschia baltica ATCC 49814]|uniref:Electron transport protein SCO1/SenC n=2 Tax=Hirschia TaxID=2723 RepID=C6XRT5_HIRBI|nr:electron transport protein SCO1/SenC [Hirschia baltica ATCC 49814]
MHSRFRIEFLKCDLNAYCYWRQTLHIASMKKSLLTSALAVTLLVSACGPNNNSSSAGSSGGGSTCASRAYENIGGPISLVDHTGAPVTQEDYKGKETLVYFGFTNCPDVCPFTLSVVGAAMDLLPADVEKPRTLLISVDPEQDTPEALAQYVESNGFPDELIGLTGTPEAIKAAADEFKTSYKRIDAPDSTMGYTMDHLSILYLMDKDWKLKTFFTSEAAPKDVAGCITELADN